MLELEFNMHACIIINNFCLTVSKMKLLVYFYKKKNVMTPWKYNDCMVTVRHLSLPYAIFVCWIDNR